MKYLHYWVLFTVVFLTASLTIYLAFTLDFNSCDRFHYKSEVTVQHGFYAGVHGFVTGEGYDRNSLSVQLDSLTFPGHVKCSDMIR